MFQKSEILKNIVSEILCMGSSLFSHSLSEVSLGFFFCHMPNKYIEKTHTKEDATCMHSDMSFAVDWTLSNIITYKENPVRQNHRHWVDA